MQGTTRMPSALLRATGPVPSAFLARSAPRAQPRCSPTVRHGRGSRTCVVRAVHEKKQDGEQKAGSDVQDAARSVSESASDRSSDEPGPASSSGSADSPAGGARKKSSLDVDKVEKILRGLQSAVEDERKAIKGERFLEMLVSLGGFKGTIAVVLAKLLNIDPFGNLHWDPTDVAVGMALILPILVTDALLMLPEWSAEPRGGARDKKKRELDTPEAMREALEELKEVAKPMSVRERLVSAAGFFQRVRVTQNPGNNLDVWQEGAVILVAHLADEMLGRAVILGGLGLWFRDRLVEGDVEFATAQSLGPWAALAALLLFEVVRKQRALLNKVQVGAAKVEQDKITGKQKVTFLTDEDLMKVPDTPEERERAVRVAVQVRDARERTAVANQIDAIRSLLELACLGTAYAATGNLAAPLAASTVSDMLFSTYQRIGAARLKKKEEQAMQKVLQKMRDKQAKKRAAGADVAAAAAAADGAAVVSGDAGKSAEGEQAAADAEPAPVVTTAAASKPGAEDADAAAPRR